MLWWYWMTVFTQIIHFPSWSYVLKLNSFWIMGAVKVLSSLSSKNLQDLQTNVRFCISIVTEMSSCHFICHFPCPFAFSFVVLHFSAIFLSSHNSIFCHASFPPFVWFLFSSLCFDFRFIFPADYAMQCWYGLYCLEKRIKEPISRCGFTVVWRSSWTFSFHFY